MKKNKPIVVVLYIAIFALLLWTVLGVFDIGGNNLTEYQMMELFRNHQI